MKKFNTLQELWSYCLYCPICKDMTRTIDISIQPYEVIELIDFRKIDSNLIIKTIYKVLDQKHTIKYYIDCATNNFTVSISEFEKNDKPVDRASSSYTHFHIMADCSQCCLSSVNSCDIEIDILKKKISNLEIDLEGLYLGNKKKKYYLIVNYPKEYVDVSTCETQEDGSRIINDTKSVRFPLSYFAFPNLKQVLKRVQTLLVFS